MKDEFEYIDEGWMSIHSVEELTDGNYKIEGYAPSGSVEFLVSGKIGKNFLPPSKIEKDIDIDRILEIEFLKWVIFCPIVIEMARNNISPNHLKNSGCREIYQTFLFRYEKRKDLDFSSILMDLEDEEAQEILSKIFKMKFNFDHVENHLKCTITRILERNWMQERESIRRRIRMTGIRDDHVGILMNRFDKLTRSRPRVKDS